MAVNSRAKGKKGELEIAALLKEHGFDARRGQQFKGTSDSPDIEHDMEGFFVEVKLRGNQKLHEWLAQADEEAGKGEVPVVFWRKDRQPWLAVLYADDFLEQIKELYEDASPEEVQREVGDR